MACEVAFWGEKNYKGEIVRSSCNNQATSQSILAYDWPGNRHQLAHAIERMAILSDDTLMDSVQLLHRCMTPDHQRQQQPAKAPAILESRSLKRMVQDYEYMVIQQAIEQHGSIRKAAAVLKTSHASLSRKITEYNLLPKP